MFHSRWYGGTYTEKLPSPLILPPISLLRSYWFLFRTRVVSPVHKLLCISAQCQQIANWNAARLGWGRVLSQICRFFYVRPRRAGSEVQHYLRAPVKDFCIDHADGCGICIGRGRGEAENIGAAALGLPSGLPRFCDEASREKISSASRRLPLLAELWRLPG